MPSLPYETSSSLQFARCYLCDSLIRSDEVLCQVCLPAIFESQIYLRWEDILARADGKSMLKVRHLSQVHCLFEYQPPLSQFVPQLKYQANRVAMACIKTLVQIQPAQLQLDANELPALLAVPLHWLKYWYRGFNQAGMLAQFIAPGLNMPIIEPCQRRRFTRAQAKLSGQQRRHNLKQAFAVTRPELIQNRHIFIVDDVVTTGATLDALAACLLNSGAKRVSAICLCWARLD